MEQRDNREETVIFTSNEDVLREYGDLFEKADSQGLDFYLEKGFEFDECNPFRFVITPNGLIAISTSSDIPNSIENVWALSTRTSTVAHLFASLNNLVEKNIGNYNLKDLQGCSLESLGYSFRIYQYNNKRDSEIIKSVLDERRMGFLMSNARKGGCGE